MSKNVINNKDFLYKLESETLYNPKNPKEKPAAYYRSIWKRQEKPKLIETISPNIIRELQHRNVKVIACTALPVCSDSLIASLPKWRAEKLKALDIDFSLSGLPDTILDNFDDENGGVAYHPVLHEGILCSGRLNKGVAIGGLFDALGITPDKVIFFDDSKKRVEEVQQEMKNRGIPFIGYEYKGEELLESNFDPDVVTLQLHYLVDQEKWLNDEEAQAIIDQNKNQLKDLEPITEN